MNFLDRCLILLTFIFAFQASYNATESHSHTHELGCALSVKDLCEYYRKDPTP